MSEDELAAIRAKKMAEMQQQAVYQEEEVRRREQENAQIHMLIMQILEPEARERLNTIRLTKPDFARAIEQQLISLAQSGRLQSKITDEQFKAILQQVTPERRNINIRRK
ncbi:MAG: DNA-binding protein [Euryarchaeota archaeon]|nr:DNA-binding protein [Euryarchaeota archaeon]